MEKLRFAKLVYLAIPSPEVNSVEQANEAMQARTAASNAYRDYVQALFPDLSDDKQEKEAEMAAFLREKTSRPIELRVTEDPTGALDISLKK